MLSSLSHFGKSQTSYVRVVKVRIIVALGSYSHIVQKTYSKLIFPIKSVKTSTVCQSRRDECLDNAPPGHLIPRCKADGSYEERQCLQSTVECWCVDRNGNELPGTRSKEMHDCSLLGKYY